MPLQIRRGTNAERLSMTVPLAQGELLYVTDDQRLYVGNGSTLGGVQITGYTNNDAQDAAAAIFTGGSHNGIGFTYNTATNLITATVDLSSYTGTINASAFKGTLVADDSTLLVDAVDGKINLNGTVKGNIIPDVTEAYDIGSASYRFRDLYLSGSSIKLGSATITASGSVVNLPASSTVNSVPIVASAAGGNVNIGILADDTSVMVNTSTKAFTGNLTGNTTGYHTGDVKGSIFGDDSTLLVDALSNTITASLIDTTTVETANLSIASNTIRASSDVTVILSSTFDDTVTVKGITDGSFGTQNASLIVSGSRGTLDTPTNTAAGDYVSRITLNGYYAGTDKSMASIVASWDSTATLTDAAPKSNVTLITGAGGSSSNYAVFNNQGVFYAPMLMTGSYATGSYPSVPSGPSSAGIIIFDSTTTTFMGYNGTTWVALS